MAAKQFRADRGVLKKKVFGQKLKYLAHSCGWIVPNIIFGLFSVTLYQYYLIFWVISVLKMSDLI
jgi:hypothetical protein